MGIVLQKSKDTQEVAPTEDSVSTDHLDKKDEERKDSTGDEQTEKSTDKQKKSSVICRDLSAEFSDSKESPRSPVRQTRSRKEEDIEVNIDGLSSKKSRSPVKSPRGDGNPVSPRKGLRSCKALELTVASEGDAAATDANEQESKVDVVSMETEQPLLTLQPLDTPVMEGLGHVSAEANEILEELQPMVEDKPTLSELLAIEKQKEDVTEISDEVAAKIREWKVQEEESVGFQGEEWYAEEVEEAEPFYFESDHMALKGNKE